MKTDIFVLQIGLPNWIPEIVHVELIWNFDITMNYRTRCSQPQLLTPSENMERMVRPQQTAVAPPRSDKTDRPTRRKENMLNLEELMTRLLKKASKEKNSDRVSLGEERRTTKPVSDGPAEQEKVLKMVEDAVNQITDTLQTRAVRVTKKKSYRDCRNGGHRPQQVAHQGSI